METEVENDCKRISTEWLIEKEEENILNNNSVKTVKRNFDIGLDIEMNQLETLLRKVNEYKA